MRTTLIALMFACAAVAQAQRPDTRFAESGLEPGDPFPSVEIHDEAGANFDTKSLKGYLTVVVSGCLT